MGILESDENGYMKVTAMCFAGQFGVVVVGLVLRRALAIVHAPKLKKTGVGRRCLVCVVVVHKAGQLR